MTFGLPMLILGGGGYRINNVARCWAYETGRILGMAVSSVHDPKWQCLKGFDAVVSSCCREGVAAVITSILGYVTSLLNVV